jgi:hypothetical protein
MPLQLANVVRHEPHNPQASPILPRVELEICRGQARNRVREVAGPVYLIGTATDCDLVLGDSRFPEVHTYIYVNPEGISLRYLGEGPPVAVEDRLVEWTRLADRDRIRTGPYEFRVHIHDGPGSDARPGKPAARGAEATESEATESEASGAGGGAQGHVEALLRDIRAALVPGGPPLRLYVEAVSPWRSVTSASGISIRRESA